MSRRPGRIWVAVAVLAIVPFKVEVHPAVEVIVRDASGGAVDGAEVRAVTRHYTLEARAVESMGRTNNSGRIRFDRRSVWACSACYAAGAARNFLSAGVHATFGPNSWITATAGQCKPTSTLMPDTASAVELEVCSSELTRAAPGRD